jgi:hypothetical protein
MGTAAEQLTSLVDSPNRYSIPHAELRAAQIEAANERLQERVGQIKLLAHRAREAGLSQVRKFSDLVPLLFAHTTYKSYPEGFVTDRKWDRLGKWLDTVSTQRVKEMDTSTVRDIDDWFSRLEAAGHFVSCSSGTTGKSAMMNASAADMAWAKRDSVAAFSWGAGVTPAQDRHMFGLAPVASVPRNLAIRDGLRAALCDPASTPFIYPVPPITVGQITSMVALRKSIADGTAKPADIAAFEATSAARKEGVDRAVGISAEALVAARKEKLYVSGMWASLYKVAEAVRALGFSGQDFHADNTIYVGGGLKGAVLPPNYREYVFETFNISPQRVLQMYGMQEISTAMPRCKAGRYHVAPWLICLPLDEGGDQLLPMADGEVVGRAAFFDLSLDGRWGGVISGDRIAVDFGQCACGSQGPTIRDNIARYADLASGDKITCAGTIDAYVRGVA